MTSLYSRDEERNIRLQRLVHDWNKSGLITDAQRERMLPELHVDLRRTNRWLRMTLFVFTYLIINAAAGLVAIVIDLESDAVPWIALLGSIVCYAAAQWVVRSYRLYRFGIEEALAIASVTFFIIAGALMFMDRFAPLYAFASATVAATIVYRRFGFVYAAVAAIFFATFFVFDLQQSDTFRRLFAAILLLTIFFFARERRQDHEWEFPGDTYAVIEAVAWGVLYVITNLRISPWLSQPDGVTIFYWSTYVVIWLLPVGGLWFAIRDRHRLMLDVNIVLALVTISTNKPYLGAAQKPWDPIVFGVMLAVVAIGLKRWLANGRNGFVAHRLLASEKEKLSIAGSATVLAPGAPAPSTRVQEPPPPSFGGGRSGGAGASGTF